MDATEIDQEVSAVRPMSYFEAELPDLPLTRLRDRTFEVLAYTLAETEIVRRPSRFTKVTLLREGADQGRDVLLLRDERVVGVIQCKRYSTAITRPMVLQELMRFALLAVRKPELIPEPIGFLYEFWTAGEITSEAQRFFDCPHTWIGSNHVSMLEAARKARLGVVALSSENEAIAGGENEAAVALVKKFNILTVGPTAIKSLLAENDRVRRRFFRGPDDQPQRARGDDVERLVARARQQRGREAVSEGRYIRRATLHREFQTFMNSPAKVLALVGGSGQGKSTWACCVRNAPPASALVDVVKGEDIHPLDQHIADTIARILQRWPLDGLTSTDLVQAVFEWLSGKSRLIIIDGIDRVSAAAASTLGDWLNRTLEISARSSTRFVITSRQATWRLVAPALLMDVADVHHPAGVESDKFPALELRPLSDEEAIEVYQAYGLAPPRVGARFFRVPGLIAREAKLRSSDHTRVGPRLAVLDEELKELSRELKSRANVGSQQFAHFIEVIGEALIEAGDGRLNASDLRRRAPELLKALDAAVEAGLAVADDDILRIEPDDFIEYLMAMRLSVERSKALLRERGGDLLIGAAALAVANLESRDDTTVRAAIETLRYDVDFESPAYAAAALAITELKSRELIREQLRETLLSWKVPNLVLGASPLVQLIDAVDLPPVERLEATMVLASEEDTSDWRGKYFFDPVSAPQRLITGFGHAAARAIAGDAPSALSYLLKLIDKAEESSEGFDDNESVLSGLLYLAIDGAPEHAAKLGWERMTARKPHRSDAIRGSQRKSKKPSRSQRWLFDRVKNNQPWAVALLLGSVTSPTVDRDLAIKELWSLISATTAQRRDDARWLSAVLFAVTAQLPLCTSDYQVVLLLIGSQLCIPNQDNENRLEALWSHVDDEIFWTALEARTSNRVKVFAERFSGIKDDQRQSRECLLTLFHPELFSIDELSDVAAILESVEGVGLGYAASSALETLLYRASALGEFGPLMPLARKFASSQDTRVRLPITYFAGSPDSHHNAEQRTARQELFDLVVEHENGENLQKVVWKVIQSSTIFDNSVERLAILSNRCGTERVIEIIEDLRKWEKKGFTALMNDWMEMQRGS